ncbi:SH3 domain-containing protein [Hyalangium sp.]|uniref:SH3 domain-containing protein n=1 Tax=Hyalangium sp. TaxID=2028555 RepID=UPI002D299AEF|nr:SH3 domain-containing protein [Hyalangium sp.]HYH96365.1 SH3 domain-containing protein [Hyalangium sp.]
MSVSRTSSSSPKPESKRSEAPTQKESVPTSKKGEAGGPEAKLRQDKGSTPLRSTALRDYGMDRFDAASVTRTPMSTSRRAADMDPRIATEAGLNVTVQPHSVGEKGTFTVDTVRFQNDQQSGGNHNVYVRVLDASGKEIPAEDMARYFDVQYTSGPGQAVTSASPKIQDPYGVSRDAWTTGANTGGATSAYFDAPMYGGSAVKVWVTPKDVPGNPYAGFGSQEVGPFSMPANHHVNYLVSFRATPSAAEAGAPATPPAAPTQPGTLESPQAPAYSTEQLVEDTYQQVLGRPSDPSGKASWVSYANHLASQGKSEQEVRDTLTAMFKQSDEYKARPSAGPVTPPVTAPAGVGGGTYAPGDVLQVSAPDGLNLRKGPGSDQERIGGLADGSTLQVTPPPEGGPASRNGWVHVSGPAGEGWVSEQYVRKAGTGSVPSPGTPGGAPAGDGRLLTPDGRPQHFVAGNYTDLGRANSGHMPHPINDEAGFRAAVNQDLDRLREMGVDNVRIWAADFPENPLGNDNAALAARVRIISEEAARRGMTVTVDLFDGATMDKDVNAYRGREEELNARIETIVGANAGASNIVWSVGNEIGDPNHASDFADWYVGKANLIRDTVRANGGDANRPLISLQVTPGALGHPTHGWDKARAAMERVVEASDIISPHFYPTAMPGQLPWENRREDGSSQGTFPQMDYDSLKVWVEIAQAQGKPVTAGEFSIPRDTQATKALSEQQYAELTEAWMHELKNLGIQQVSFWQLAKDDVGHVDPASVDYIVGDNAGDSRTLIDRLRGNGWFN